MTARQQRGAAAGGKVGGDPERIHEPIAPIPMQRPPSENDEVESLSPLSHGRIFRLRPAWKDLLERLPELEVGAVIHRSPHALLCRLGKFPAMRHSGTWGFRLGCGDGDTLRTELWSEAWWYDEWRDGMPRTCLEIADDRGRGFLKLCYRSRVEAARDLPKIEDLFDSEVDAWDILHLRQANILDCSCLYERGLPKAPAGRYCNALMRIFHEACQRQAPLGVILPNQPATAWEALTPESISLAGCWTTVGSQGRYLHFRSSHLRRVKLISCEVRAVAMFYERGPEPALTLIEPDGVRLEALRALADHPAEPG